MKFTTQIPRLIGIIGLTLSLSHAGFAQTSPDTPEPIQMTGILDHQYDPSAPFGERFTLIYIRGLNNSIVYALDLGKDEAQQALMDSRLRDLEGGYVDVVVQPDSRPGPQVDGRFHATVLRATISHSNQESLVSTDQPTRLKAGIGELQDFTVIYPSADQCVNVAAPEGTASPAPEEIRRLADSIEILQEDPFTDGQTLLLLKAVTLPDASALQFRFADRSSHLSHIRVRTKMGPGVFRRNFYEILRNIGFPHGLGLKIVNCR